WLAGDTGGVAVDAVRRAGQLAGDAATVTVDVAHPAGRLASDAVGLSFEERELGIGNLDPDKGNMAQLMRTLGPSNLRIGGNTLDRDTLWVPAGQAPPDPKPEWVQDVVTPTDIKRLRGLLDATGWTAEVGVNVGHWDRALAADQIRAMDRLLGKRLVAIECGNEPDQWEGKALRPPGYAYPQYHADWSACADLAGHPRIAGPDTAGTSSSWASSLAADEHDRMAMLTVHQYAAGPDITIDRMLSPAQITSQLHAVGSNLAAARAAGLPMRVDEANSAYSGGVDGVSNKYASALWVVDYGLSMAQAGLAGVNIHGGLGVCNDPIWNGKFQRYTPICAASQAYELAQSYKVMPIYYGIWMARQMGHGRFLPVTVDTTRNISAYAVKGDDGRTRIALVQKDATAAAPVDVTLSIGGGARSARVLRMTGPALNQETTAVQGSTVDAAGRFRPVPSTVPVTGDQLTISVAAGSAVVITL
ncbi:MAG: glycosyl hydrolase family protein, partial [Catenulispora sp.]